MTAGAREAEPSPRSPMVSIGIPVYNGATLLPRALDSILGQTYADLEVIICDNASTDGTDEVAREYAGRDPRVTHVRNETNLGAPRNFNRAFALASGEYFKWASHDDALEPDFIASCVAVLESDPEAVACFSRGVIVDSSGHVLKPLPDYQLRIGDPAAHRRFADVIRPAYGCFHVWSLMRSEAIRRTRLHGSYPGSDRVYLAEMALQGPFRVVPEALFRLGHHGERSVASLPTIYDRATWHDTRKRGRATLPHWRIGLGHLRAVNRATVTRGERLRCYAQLIRWVWLDWNWAKLLFDPVMALAPASRPLFITARRWVRRRRKAHRAAGLAPETGPVTANERAVVSDGEELGS